MEWFAILALVLSVWRLWDIRRESLRRAEEPIGIEGRTRPWGWPDAPRPLVRVENQGTSVLFLRARWTAYEVIGTLFGAMLLLTFLVALVRSLVDDDPAGGAFLVVTGVFAVFGWALLHTHSRLVRIELTPDAATFYSRYALFLYARARISGSSARRVRFETKAPGVRDMWRGQQEAETDLFVKGRFPGLRLILDCEQREADFVARGLRDWQASLAR